jgi:hypothetical protein
MNRSAYNRFSNSEETTKTMRTKWIPAAWMSLALSAFAQSPMTNEDVVRMARQGIAPAAIIEAIQTTRTQDFHVIPSEQPVLERDGVPQKVIFAMVERVMKDQARSNVRSESSSPVMELRPSPPVQRRIQASEWNLDRGRPELVWHAGGGVFANRGGGLTEEWYTGSRPAGGSLRIWWPGRERVMQTPRRSTVLWECFQAR